MRINYYLYNFQNVDTSQKLNFNISTVLENSTNKANQRYVDLITYNDEKLYLIKLKKDFYLFVQTKNKEIVKAVEDTGSGLSASDLAAKLAANENMGFASYIMIDQNNPLLSFASRVLSPTINAFAFYVEQLLKAMKVRDLSFNLNPIKTKLSKADVVNLDFIGRTSFQVAYGPAVQNILNAFNGNAKSIALEDIEGLEIVIKPKRRKSINNRVINAIGFVAQRFEIQSPLIEPNLRRNLGKWST